MLRNRTPYKSTLPKITEIEEKTADLWLSIGTIRITETGHENTYYVDQFDNQFFCKNYPR
jgi:hypothetical protein